MNTPPFSEHMLRTIGETRVKINEQGLILIVSEVPRRTDMHILFFAMDHFMYILMKRARHRCRVI